jgi:hypothetical protein
VERPSDQGSDVADLLHGYAVYVLEAAVSVGLPAVDAVEAFSSFITLQHPQPRLGESLFGKAAPDVVDQQSPYPAVPLIRVDIDRIQLADALLIGISTRTCGGEPADAVLSHGNGGVRPAGAGFGEGVPGGPSCGFEAIQVVVGQQAAVCDLPRSDMNSGNSVLITGHRATEQHRDSIPRLSPACTPTSGRRGPALAVAETTSRRPILLSEVIPESHARSVPVRRLAGGPP